MLLNCGYLSVIEAQETIISLPETNDTSFGKTEINGRKQIEQFSEFLNHFPIDEGVSTNQTNVQLSHDGVNLYIQATYHDIEVRDNISTLKRDNYEEGVFLSDCFSVILDPYNNGDNGYLFAVNAAGVQYDALIGNSNSLNDSWSTIWTSQTSKKGSDKIYEIAIPLDAINFDINTSLWGIQFAINDTKINQFSTLEYVSRNFPFYDLRHTRPIQLENLPNSVTNKFSLLPSVTANIDKEVTTTKADHQVKLSLNGQYNITPALRMDLAINPDFSQVEVDQQVTNLTRFAINFPERRKFFLENSDLFNNLGTGSVNPFNSRQVGANTNILYGGKLSGNISSNTRMGVLHTKTQNNDEEIGKGYTVGVIRQNIATTLNTTTYVVNTESVNSYNRIGGLNMNYRSPNNKWAGTANYSKSITKHNAGNSNFFNGDISYNTPEFDWHIGYQKTQQNYIADAGFIPQQFNYNAERDIVSREGFSILSGGFQIRKYLKSNDKIDWIRRFWIEDDAVFNQDGSLRNNTIFCSPLAIRFSDRSYTYVSILNSIDNLNIDFDFLQNGNPISPDRYVQTYGRIGYWTTTNKKFYMNAKLEYGQFYNGTRLNPDVRISYRMLPKAVLSASYAIQSVDLKQLGQRTFHLAKVTSEVYFNNRMNWTTYLQYNTQRNNFNINSRIQWEYQPLSYVYLVFTNNYNNDFENKNWGISLKVNRRFDF